jgi:hypothetical protein
LSRAEFGFDSEKQKIVLDKIKEFGCFTMPDASDVPFFDESDRIFYDTAKENIAILITGEPVKIFL